MDDSLSSWYLARLRKLAWDAHDSRATPMTMLKTDKALLQKLVAESADSQEERQRALFKTISQRTPRYSGVILISIAIGLITILLASQFWRY